MFFRETFSKSSKHPVLQLVENTRTDKGPRQKVIVSLGTHLIIPKNNRSEVARAIEERLIGQNSMFNYEPEIVAFADKVVKKIQTEGKWNSARNQACKIDQLSHEGKLVAEVFVDEIQHSYNRELGPVLVGHCFWERLGFPFILRSCGFNERQIQTAEISILNRLIAADSEHSIISWLDTVALADIVGCDVSQFGDDRFYRISDKLLKNKESIEKLIYENQKSLFNLEESILLYDLTNTHFEGNCASNPKAEYNANQKQKRTDCPQVVVALVIDQQGFVQRHDVFNGKLTDVKSLGIILEKLKSKFNASSKPTIIFNPKEIPFLFPV